MTEAQLNETILQAWKSGWELLHPPAGDFVYWTQENDYGDSREEFVRISIVPTTRRNASVGAKKRKAQEGYVAVQLFTRTGTGTLRINQLADDVRTVLENKHFYAAGDDEPVHLYEGESDPPTGDGAWQMKLIRIGLRADHVS